MPRRLISTAAALLALTAAPALAEVKSATPVGFEVGGSVAISAPPARVWAVLTAPDDWWSREHRWFRNSTLTLDLAAGGCWCEQAAGGRTARHLETLLVEPGAKLILQGVLGPLIDQGVVGSAVFDIKAEGEGSILTWSYSVGGYTPGGLEAWARPVDGVLSAQLASLKTRAEAAD
ncbi:SRPBCC family protein [Brevundimonas sp.]|uniref:SRPBCC family protein n=1 Tax=Brevundimonas sp. TaxID=1871086 RepID=UPI002EDABFFF